MRVEEIMTVDLAVVAPDTPVKQVAVLLVDRGIGAVPVVGPGRELLGIITEADLIALEEAPDPVRHIRRDLPDATRAARTAADVMTSPVVAARLGADVADVIELMLSEHLTRMPVLDGRDRLVGLVSRSDLVRPLARPDEEIAVDVRRVLADWDPAAAVQVAVVGGEVTLRVPGCLAWPQVDHLVRAVPGVLAVVHASA